MRTNMGLWVKYALVQSSGFSKITPVRSKNWTITVLVFLSALQPTSHFWKIPPFRLRIHCYTLILHCFTVHVHECSCTELRVCWIWLFFWETASGGHLGGGSLCRRLQAIHHAAASAVGYPLILVCLPLPLSACARAVQNSPWRRATTSSICSADVGRGKQKILAGCDLDGASHSVMRPHSTRTTV